MTRGRLEAFSDGVLAIIITIMVLELKVPHEPTFEALGPLLPVFVSYVLSFVLIGTYWNNHHHMLQAAKVINGRVLWANLLLLFWLSLFPFTTAWMGENAFAAVPTAAYGVVQVLAALSYTILAQVLVRVPDQPPALAEELGRDIKGRLSLISYLVAIPVALVVPLAGLAIYFAVVAMWLIPDQRMERALGRGGDT